MKFGKRLIAEEFVQNFFEICEEDGCNYTEMKERLNKIDENKDKMDGVNHYSITRIQERLYNLESCPRCDGDFFYDEENEEKYCPRCFE